MRSPDGAPAPPDVLPPPSRSRPPTSSTAPAVSTSSTPATPALTRRPPSHPAGRATLRDLPERTHRTRRQPAMRSYTRWTDIRAAHVERAGGEQVVEAGKQELLATVVGHRLAELRRTRGLTQQQIAD